MRTRSVALFRCNVCGHTVADHLAASDTRDYHDQYDAEFASALQRTRQRQARRIVKALRDGGDDRKLVDFGCGRGWFLDECRRQNIASVAGLDTSPLAVSLLQERGVEARLLPLPGSTDWQIPSAALSFRAEVVTLLDVVEHFPASALSNMFRAIVNAFSPHLRTVVVKVPVSNGLLYRLARMSARAGVTGALDQLYQAGTFPPHFHYFSRQSLHRFLAKMGFTVVKMLGDPDFDIAGFERRVGMLSRLPAMIGRSIAAGLWATTVATRQVDTVIAIARVRPGG